MTWLGHMVDDYSRQHPAVIAAANTIFLAIALALEAETIQSATAHRVAAAAQRLVQIAGIDANRILATLSPETQHRIRGYFA